MPSKLPPRKDKNRVPRTKRALTPLKKDAERVAKVIARAGLGSRREIEEWIAAGRVAVNGAILESPAITVTAEDAIEVDGAPLPERERTRLFLYHKPKGVVTTNRDPEGRTTLFEILPQGLPRLVSVGRLDLNSEGLLLLTNDGGLARALELPETGWLRRYRVRAKGEIDQARLDGLLKGITVEGIEYGPIEATLDRIQGANAWITVALREGKNREVRNVLAALGMQVNRLLRVSYGPFQLGEIPEGEIEEVRTRILRDQLGADIVAASGADFDGPLVERTLEAPPARPAQRADEEDGARRGPSSGPRQPRTFGREPESRGRARHPAGEEELYSFRLRSRRANDEREVESRGTVADRKGREIKVERMLPARAEEAPERRSGPGKGRFGGKGERFDDERRPSRPGGPGERPGPRRPDAGFEEGPRGRRPGGAEGGQGYRGERSDTRRDERPARFDDTRPRRPRPEGGPSYRERREDGSGREDFRRGERPGGREDARPRRPRPEGEAPRQRREGGPGREEFRRRDDRASGAREDSRPRRPRPEGGDSRPPRRDDRASGSREEFRPRRPRPEGEGARPPRRDDRASGPREEFRPRRPRPEGEDARPRRREEGSGRDDFRREDRGPPRGGPKGRPEGRPGGGKPRGESRGEPRDDVGFVDRGGPGGARPPRAGGPPKGRGAPGGAPKGRPGGGKSFGGKSFGGKSFGGKPSGGRPSGGRPSGGKPSGGRPSGGKPSGPRSRG